MFAMFGGELYSRRMARTVLSVRNRMRPPLGHCARIQTCWRKVDFNRTGRRINSPPFSLNHGRPLISRARFVTESQRRFAGLETLLPDPIGEWSFVDCATALNAKNEPVRTESTTRQRNRAKRLESASAVKIKAARGW